jgi:hypothetical protein
MKKRLNTEAVENELRGGSLFFRRRTEEETAEPMTETAPANEHQTTAPAQEHGTVIIHPPVAAEAEGSDGLVDAIKLALKAQGKDAATYRFTEEERRALAEITFSYKQTGPRTTENEVVRVAVNYLIQDHRRNGRTSVLCQVLEKLRQ